MASNQTFKLALILLQLVLCCDCFDQIWLNDSSKPQPPPSGAECSAASEEGASNGAPSFGSFSTRETALASREPANTFEPAKTGFDLNEDKLVPELTISATSRSAAGLQASENYFHLHDKLSGKYSIASYVQMMLISTLQSAAYNDMYLQRYDNFDELRLAAGPLVDGEACLLQLNNMVERASAGLKLKYRSRDLNLYQILDTFGRVPAGFLLGHTYFEGMFHECTRLKLELPPREGAASSRVPLRYCVAKLRHVSWPNKIDKHKLLAIRVGVCLPKSCDGLDYKNKHKLVFDLIGFNLREFERRELEMSDSVYCLPDEDSPLRSLKSSPKSLITFTSLIGWILFLFYATHKDQSEGLFVADAQEKTSSKLIRALSIRNNLKRLLSTSRAAPQEADGLVVDLRCIESVKVISMVYVIIGHALVCLTPLMENNREMSTFNSFCFYLANMLPAFTVNSFFTITGILTSYKVAKQNQTNSPLSSTKWISLIVVRYLRIMPMYALVVLYTKTLAKFAGSGPLWDYATSSQSQRSVCEQESWLWTLCFGANFLSPLRHCIPSGWYLASDFQFLLVTPLFLALLNRKRGERALLVSILLGYLLGVAGVLFARVDDLLPIAKFAQDAFKSYAANFGASYTQPHFRIPAYLIGLLIGHKLFKFESAKLKYLETKHGLTGEDVEPNWSAAFKQRAVALALFGTAFCFGAPLVGAIFPFSKLGARITVALFAPAYHILFASTIGVLVLLSATGHCNAKLNTFLVSPNWKPLARLSLCVALINIEVINYIIQSNSNLHYFTNSFLMSSNMLLVAATYFVAATVWVLFEAPISGLLSLITKQTAATRQPFGQKGEKVGSEATRP